MPVNLDHLQCPWCRKTDCIEGPYAKDSFYCKECRLNFTRDTPMMPQCPTGCGAKHVKNIIPPSSYTSQCSYCGVKFNHNVSFSATPLPGESMFYIVLNHQLHIMGPDASGFYKTIDATTPMNKNYFDEDKKELAEKFVEWLAHKNQGHRFYLAKVEDYAQTQEPPVVWKNKSK